MSKSISKSLVASATALLSISSFAGDINWSGFISVVGGQMLNDSDIVMQPGPGGLVPVEKQQYNTGFFGYNGGTYGQDFSFEQESMIGLQGQTLITDKLRATVQVTARGGEAWDAKTEWAFLSYNVNDELTINAGRLRTPLYYFSDFLDVGYAYDWVRPPAELYAGNPGVNGISSLYSTYVGPVEFTNQTWFGTETIDAGTLGTIRQSNVLGTNATLTWEDIKFRVVYSTMDIDFVDSLGETDFEFMGVGIFYDNGSLKINFERTNTQVGDTQAVGPIPAQSYGDNTLAYYSIGYNFGEITPHYTFTTRESNDFTRAPETETHTLGVAWDFHSNARLKLEYLVTNEVDTTYDDDIDLITAAIDIVF